jgi:hypothetical protein
MKSSALLPALLFCLLQAADVSAQQVRLQPEQQTFAIGFAPFSLLLPGGKFNLHGEWAYSDNKSLSLLVSIPRQTPAPALIGNNFDLADNVDATVSRLRAYGATLEHRFYLGKNALHGFYLAPYSRYNHFSIERTTQNAGAPFKTTVKGAAGGFGFGAAAGVQFRFGDFLTLDATLAGVDFKWLNGTFTYSSDDPETDLAAFRDQVQETVGDLPFIGSKLAAVIEGNTIKVRTPGWVVPAYRFNLTLNYVF